MNTTEVTISAQLAIEKMVDSYQLYNDGYKTRDEHLQFCTAIRFLFGEEVFENIISPEVQKEETPIPPGFSPMLSERDMTTFDSEGLYESEIVGAV